MISPTDYCVLLELDDRWKWIARDSYGSHGGNLFAYSAKPYKDYYTKDWRGSFSEWFSVDNHLFQFIQWDESEPYNIQKLVEEYEREEAEMKSKEELIEKWEAAIEAAEFYGSGREDELIIGYMKDFVRDLSQLEEPEVLSQEWIDKNKFEVNGWNEAVHVEDLQDLLVPSQELPSVDKEDAKNIVRYKSKGWTLSHLLNDVGVDAGHDELLARAWIAYPNIEVEEEQKYNVEIKAKSSSGTVGIFLYKQGDEVLAGDNFEAYDSKEDKYRLTEQEIRDFQNGNILFEHFSVKVEELEE